VYDESVGIDRPALILVGADGKVERTFFPDDMKEIVDPDEIRKAL
jgi:hypothetical protein